MEETNRVKKERKRSMENVELSFDCSSTGDEVCLHNNQEEYVPHRKRIQLLSNTVCKVADKHQISQRALAELFSAHVISQGENLEDYTLSVMTSNRKRDFFRTKNGK